MKAQSWRSCIALPLTLTSALNGVGGQCHAPTPLHHERPDTHCIGGWVGPGAGMERCEK